MNRIALASEDTIAAPTPATDHLHDFLTTTRRASTRGLDLPYFTFAPIHYEERYAYPLIVWLHDAGGNEQELPQVMPLVSMRNYVAVAPRGTCDDNRFEGEYDWRQTTDAIEKAQSQIDDAIAAAKRRFNIHDERIFLVGHGTGGTMAVRAAWNDPEKFAGVVSINGPLPTRLSPLRRVNELRHVPCLLATSRDSQSYPADRVCNDLRLLHTAGCTVALRQYPCGDSLTSMMLSDLDRWLMELVCGGSSHAA